MGKSAYSTIALLAAVAIVQGQSDAGRRALTVDDLLKLETVDEVTIAPDGNTLAFVRRRPVISAPTRDRSRSDVWIASMKSTGSPVNITNGDHDSTTYWMPTWAPDGGHLAMLSTKNGGDICLWIWDKHTGHLSRLSEGGIATEIGREPFAWIGTDRLAVVLLPEQDRPLPRLRLEQRGIATASREWAKSQAGKEATASVLDSATPVDLSKRPQQQIVLLNITGAAQLIGSAASISNINVAPDHRRFALDLIRIGGQVD